MADRYQPLLQLPRHQYQAQAPLILEAGALLRDTLSDRLIAQLKLQNIADKPVKAAYVAVTCYDMMHHQVGGEVIHKYLDLAAAPGQMFGDQTPLVLSDPSIRCLDVRVTDVLFADGTVWRADDDAKFLELPKADELSLTKPQLAQLNRESKGKKSEYTDFTCAPQKTDYLWQCACQQWNLTDNADCVHCRCPFDWLEQASAANGLQSRLEAYERNVAEEKEAARLAKEKADQEMKVRAERERNVAERQERLRKRKRNKTLAIVIPLAVILIAVMLLLTQVVIPKNKYQTAMDLLANKQYDEAVAAFSELDEYSDSATMVKESTYQKGKALADVGSYPEAAAIFIEIKDYKDSASLLSGYQGLSAAAAAAAAAELERVYSVGKTVTFGAYEQDNNEGNGKEAIQWRVLAREGSKALLISVYNLDCQPYNTKNTSVTWETCTLRGWLNGTFLNTAFMQAQRNAIVMSTLQNDKNSEYNTSGGNSMQDKVFLLGEAEAEQHFTGDSDRIAKNTTYAKAQGAFTDDNGAGWWWLRSPGDGTILAAYVSNVGSVYRYGFYVDRDSLAVRPALYLDLSSL